MCTCLVQITKPLKILIMNKCLSRYWQLYLFYLLTYVICYFSNRNSVVKQSPLNAYCSSLYGCELWDLSHPGVQNVCAAWKGGLRRIWSLPYDSHSNLLPLLSDSLPIFICLRSVNFCKSVYQMMHQLFILYHFTAYFMDVLSHRFGVTSYFVVNGIM